MQAFRLRHGKAFACTLSIATVDEIARLMEELGLQSQRALVTVAIDVLRQMADSGALQRVER